MRPTRRVCVYQGVGPADAFLVRDYLQAHQLTVELRGQDLGGLAGALPMQDVWPSLWVLAPHASRARELIAEWDAAKVPGGPDWQCTCGAQVDAHFGECWSCGCGRP